ncbi:hypothetical protein COLO4_38308 [Corchorus olitorius]|uniref:Uncharacterized protein n=1 Tax=Corchorus olitorius TaxID=93759 RepID=A0A1R3FVM9_9ROSI|nr:hypothetical protein COLO4_38308 [Corchorus olitorius]
MYQYDTSVDILITVGSKKSHVPPKYPSGFKEDGASKSTANRWFRPSTPPTLVSVTKAKCGLNSSQSCANAGSQDEHLVRGDSYAGSPGKTAGGPIGGEGGVISNSPTVKLPEYRMVG